MKRYLVSLACLVVFLAATPVARSEGLFKVGQPAPLFSLTSIAGEPLSLENLRGRVVVLGLFHICEPCLIQGTNLQRVHEATREENVTVVGVNSSGDSLAAIEEFLDTFPLTVTYPYLTDPEQITDPLYGGGRFIPNVYVLDQSGVIRWQRIGNMALADHTSILEAVRTLLAGGKVAKPTG